MKNLRIQLASMMILNSFFLFRQQYVRAWMSKGCSLKHLVRTTLLMANFFLSNLRSCCFTTVLNTSKIYSTSEIINILIVACFIAVAQSEDQLNTQTEQTRVGRSLSWTGYTFISIIMLIICMRYLEIGHLKFHFRLVPDCSLLLQQLSVHSLLAPLPSLIYFSRYLAICLVYGSIIVRIFIRFYLLGP